MATLVICKFNKYGYCRYQDICKFFREYGLCKFGEWCKFTHKENAMDEHKKENELILKKLADIEKNLKK